MIISYKYNEFGYHQKNYTITYDNKNKLPENELKAALLKECINKFGFLFDANIWLYDEKTALYSGYID